MKVKILIGSIGYNGNVYSRNEIHDIDNGLAAQLIEQQYAEQVKEPAIIPIPSEIPEIDTPAPIRAIAVGKTAPKTRR